MQLKTLPPVEAVLFDLDGLLVDTEPLQKQAFEDVCNLYSDEPFALTDELHAQFVGKSDKRNAQTVIDLLKLCVGADRLVEERADIYLNALRSTGAPPMPGARETLDAAHTAGLKLAVGSSSIRRFVEASLDGAFRTMRYPVAWRDLFGAVVCGDDPDVEHRKPAPDIYLRCAERLDVDPAACVVLEDSGSGIESALRAGIMRAVAVPNRYTGGHDFAGAYRTLKSVDEVVTTGIVPNGKRDRIGC